MSFGDDYCSRPGCGRARAQHSAFDKGMWFDGHTFVEPEPRAATCTHPGCDQWNCGVATHPNPDVAVRPGKTSLLETLVKAQRKPRTTVKRFAAELNERLSRVAVAFSEPGQEQAVAGIVYAKSVIDTALTDYDTRDAGDFFPANPDAAAMEIVDRWPIVRNGDGIFDARATQAIAFASGVAAANTDWESALGPLLEHNGCDCDEETDAEDFELCFAHRVQNVINERKAGK